MANLFSFLWPDVNKYIKMMCVKNDNSASKVNINTGYRMHRKAESQEEEKNNNMHTNNKAQICQKWYSQDQGEKNVKQEMQEGKDK